MKPQDISNEPDMIELEQMTEAGEIGGDRVARYAWKKAGKDSTTEKEG